MPTRTAPRKPAPEIPVPVPEDAEPMLRVVTKKKKRPTIEVDGVFYDFRLKGDFGINEQQKLDHDGREFSELWSSPDELTEDQGKRLKQLLDRMFYGTENRPPLIDAPREILDAFDDAQKADVVLTFTYAPLRAMAAALEEQQKKQQVEAQDSPSTGTS